VFVLAPLAGLLLVSRPASLREWAWLMGCGIWCAAWLTASGGLADQMMRAAGVLLAGAVITLALTESRRLLHLAASAVGMAAAGLALWCAALRVSWREIELAAAHDLWRGFTAQAQAAAELPGDFGAQASRVFRELAGQSRELAGLMPAALVVAALAGVALAWYGYHRIAARPLGGPPQPFAQFSFSDHAVWTVIAGFALTLAPVPAPLALAGANLLLVAFALYALRGAAVIRAVTPPMPGPVVAGVVIASLFLLAFVLGGLVALGIADTWLHFRRRLATPSTGGLDR
jgi:hypothetical protein